jgi:SAM-dependent methyltransferase
MNESRDKRRAELQRRREQLSPVALGVLAHQVKSLSATEAERCKLRHARPTINAWTPRPLSADVWESALAAARTRASVAPADAAALETYQRDLEARDRIAFVTVCGLLESADLLTCEHPRASPADVAARLGAVPAYHGLVRRWLSTLARAGLLRRDGDAFVRGSTDAGGEHEQQYSANELEQARQRVLEVIRGQRHGLDVFSMESRGAGRSPDFLEGAVQAFERHAWSRYLNDVLAAALGAVGGVADQLRVLEVGAGVGGTTSAALAALRGVDHAYVFTDISSGFFSFVTERLQSDAASLLFDVLDLDIDPMQAGYPSGVFDVVIGSNALHCARHLPRTLAHLRRLLAPHGLLLMREGTTNSPHHMVTQGLLPGATVYEDSRLNDDAGPLLRPEHWFDLLQAAGFDRFACLPEAGQPTHALDERVMLAAGTQ